MSDWIKDSPTDHLRKIRGSHSRNSPECRAADEEIQRREAEESRTRLERADQMDAQRHQENVALEKAASETENRRFQIQLDETRRQNWWTRVIAIAALVVSALGFLASIWMHFHPIAPAPSATSTPSSSSQSPTRPTPRP